MAEWREAAERSARIIFDASEKEADELDEVERLVLGGLMFGVMNAEAAREKAVDISSVGRALVGTLAQVLDLENRTAAEYVRFYTRCTQPDFHPVLHEIILRGAQASRYIDDAERVCELVQSTLQSSQRQQCR